MKELAIKSSALAGFEKYYQSEIYPALADLEIRRKNLYKKAGRQGLGVFFGGLVIAALIFLFARIVPLALVIAAISAFAGFGVRQAKLAGFKQEIKQLLLQKTCAFLGWEFNQSDFAAPDLTVLISNHILPEYDRAGFEDEIKGRFDDKSFYLCEAKLEKQDRDSDGDIEWRTVFHGIIMEVDFAKQFLGRTIVVRDAGWFNPKARAKMKRVGLESIKFEKIFEAYSTDQVEARYLLTPDFMQNLIDLEASIDGKKIRFGFLGGRLYIACETGNQFEAGNMGKALTDKEQMQKLINEFEAIINILQKTG